MATTPPVVQPLPAAPNRNDAPADFSTKADAFVAALPPMVTQENALATWTYSVSSEISGYATSAGTSATNAQTYANQALASKNAAAQSATDATNNGAAQVALAAAQVALAQQARDSAQAYATAAGSAAGFPTLTNPFDVLTVNSDKTGVVWGSVQQVGDMLWTVRAPGSTYLAANGSVYLKSAYPALAALLTSVSDLPNTTPISKLLPTSATWSDVVYSPGAGGTSKFVAVARGPSTASAYSANAITWTALTMPSSQNWAATAASSTWTVAIAAGTNILAYFTTANATPAWLQAASLPVTANWIDIASDGSNFLAIGSAGECIASSAAINTWTQPGSPSGTAFTALIYAGGRYVVTGTSTSRRVGTTWTLSSRQPSAPLGCLAYGGGVYVGLGSGSSNVAAVSTDGDIWDSVTLPEYADWTSVSYGNGYFVGVSRGITNLVIYSADGYTWQTQKAPTKGGRSSIAFGANVFAILPVSGTTAESWMSFSYDSTTQFVTPNPPPVNGVTAYIKAKVS